MTTNNRCVNSSSGLDDAESGTLKHYVDASIRPIQFLSWIMAIPALVGIVSGQPALAEDLLHGPLMDNLFGFGVMLLYYIGFEAVTGRTVGKLVTGTKVVTLQGHAPSALQVLGRTLIRFVPFEPFSFFGSEPRGWHDRWSNTRVVRLRCAKWQRDVVIVLVVLVLFVVFVVVAGKVLSS